MSAPLPELLGALAAIFARPGAFPRTALVEAGLAPWASPALKEGLGRLLASESPELAVAFTDAFVVSQMHPVLHLEASAQRTGLLRDPALLHDLDHHYEALGFEPPDGFSLDHLAVELQALAAGLQRLGGVGADAPYLVSNLAGLIDLHLLPLLIELRRVSKTRHLHPAYAAAIAVTVTCVELVWDGIVASTDRIVEV